MRVNTILHLYYIISYYAFIFGASQTMARLPALVAFRSRFRLQLYRALINGDCHDNAFNLDGHFRLLIGFLLAICRRNIPMRSS